ncbi:MAG: TVP38/TMEM64 family protein [Thermoanaerobaculia bacterium]|nr:TVP38/TMEM64 family protein [Thermoanaerobaculia bacterium]
MADTPAPMSPTPPKKSPVVPILIGIAALVALFFLFRALPVKEWLVSFQGYVTGLGFAGYVLYAIVYAVCCVLFVPASVLTLGAGAIYGLGTGTAVVLVGATLGATLSFLLARTVMRKRIEGMTGGNAKFQALDRAIGKEGAKIVFLVRLAPVFPFTYINYAFGLTGVRTLPYVVASFFGMIPGTFAYVYLGSAAAGAASGEADSTKMIVQIAGAAVALVVTIFVARVATKAIKSAGVDESSSPTP